MRLKSRLCLSCVFCINIIFSPSTFAGLYTDRLETTQMSIDNGSVETVEVVGSRILKGSQDGAFSTITRAQIDQINALSTLDLLRRLPHVEISQNGPGGLSYLSLRGGESNFTLIMIDGIVVNDSTNSQGGGFDFSQINPSAIESINVYRGGISAIYGGEAISGLVHIKTRSDAEGELTLELGNNQQLVGSLTRASQLSENLTALLNISQVEREQSAFASSKSQQGLIKLSADFGQQLHQFLLTFNKANNTSFAEDSGGSLYANPKTPENRKSEQWLLGLNSKFKITKDTFLNTKLSWLQRKEDSNHPGIADGLISGIPPSEIQSDYDRKEAEIYVSKNFSDKTSAVFGANVRKAVGENSGFLDYGFALPVDYSLSQKTKSLFAEGKFAETSYSLSVGWRIDDSDQFSSESSWRFASSYLLSDELDLFAVYNEGYKLPSFFALAHPLIGNSDLQPERSENIELGLRYSKSDTNIAATVFKHSFSDLVDFDANLFTNVNRNKVDTQGVELSVSKTALSYLTVSADVSYTDIEVNNGPSELRRRPKWSGSMGLDVIKKRWSFGVFLDYSGKRLDSSIATSLVELGSYSSMGMAGKWAYSESLKFSVTINNVFAKEIEESLGFIDDDRLARLGLHYTFN